MDRNWSRTAMWIAAIVVVGWMLRRFGTLVGIAVVAGMITFPIFPLVDWLELRGRMSRGIAAAITMLGVVLLITVGIVIVIPWVAGQIEVLLRIAPQGLQALRKFVAHWQSQTAGTAYQSYLEIAVQRTGETLIGAANTAASGVVGTAIAWLGKIYLVLLVPFVIYFVLIDYRQIREAGLAFIHQPARSRIEALLATLTSTLRWGLWAQVIVSSIVGAIEGIGLALLGVPGALAIGIFGGIAEAIPYIGGFATYVVALLAAAPMAGSTWVWAMVVVTVAKLLSNILVPLILGRMTHTHPLAIMASLLILGEVFGVLGMFFAVPAVVVVREVYAWWRGSARV